LSAVGRDGAFLAFAAVRVPDSPQGLNETPDEPVLGMRRGRNGPPQVLVAGLGGGMVTSPNLALAESVPVSMAGATSGALLLPLLMAVAELVRRRFHQLAPTPQA
jgi:hypothetical protein